MSGQVVVDPANMGAVDPDCEGSLPATGSPRLFDPDCSSDPAAPSSAAGVSDHGGRPDSVTASGLPPALHDGSPTARRTDPTTSRDYGRGDPSRNRQCARVLAAIAAKGRHGATCAEVVAMLRTDRGNTARRVTDLTRRGLIEATGPTRTTPAGRRQLVHYVTVEGLQALPAARRLIGGAS